MSAFGSRVATYDFSRKPGRAYINQLIQVGSLASWTETMAITAPSDVKRVLFDFPKQWRQGVPFKDSEKWMQSIEGAGEFPFSAWDIDEITLYFRLPGFPQYSEKVYVRSETRAEVGLRVLRVVKNVMEQTMPCNVLQAPIWDRLVLLDICEVNKDIWVLNLAYETHAQQSELEGSLAGHHPTSESTTPRRSYTSATADSYEDVPGNEQERKEEVAKEGELEEDEMIRLRRAAAGRETLPLLHPTPDLSAGPPSFTPPSTSSTSYQSASMGSPSSSTPFANDSTSKASVVGGAPPVQRIPSSRSDDFGDFVDAPPSAGVPALSMDMNPLTPEIVHHANPLPTSSTSSQSPFDPLQSTSTAVSLPSESKPPPLDPLSFSSPLDPPQEPQPPSSKDSLLPPTPLTSSGPPPPPPKSARPSNLVDEVLQYERGGLSLFSDPVFMSPSSPAPAPPPKSPSPLRDRQDWTSRTATPTPSGSSSAIAYDGDLLSPTPIHPQPTTPPNTAANPGGVFRDHPLAPTPGSSRSREREPKVTTPHLPPAVPSKVAKVAGGKSVEETLKGAASHGAETEIIAHHLGLIDGDYFSSREPADSSNLV
ncbi:hypothetical protein NMY22_g9393 [Coprinellus aureogranulatus]|nr:hypothetical protein NMY22_g9393 [Coprinellus aureogranulatus]